MKGNDNNMTATDKTPTNGREAMKAKEKLEEQYFNGELPKLPNLTAPGAKVLIWTMTMYVVGEVVATSPEVGQEWIVIKGGSWVAATGRFSDCLKEGKFSESEKVPGHGLIQVLKENVVLCLEWNHPLP